MLKRIFFFHLLSVTLLLTAVAGPNVVAGVARAQAFCPASTPIKPAPPNLAAASAVSIPPDVCIPTVAEGQNPIAYFDEYSWKAFISLVWPVQKDHRGIADSSVDLTSTDAPTVFESYKADWETFQPDGAAPTAWEEGSSNSLPCSGAKPGDFLLSSFTKFGNVGEAGVGNLAAVLIAQNGTFVRYLAAYNKIEFDEILSKKWYLASHLPENQNPKGPPISFPNGSIDIKSSWIDMKGVPHPERYHKRNAWLQDPITGACGTVPVQVGLVGLHLVQKTSSRPQWIWSTFEHVDNVPPLGYVPPPGSQKPSQTFAFNDGTATAMPAALPNEYVWSAAISKPPPPINIQRLTPINNDGTVVQNTMKTNTLWQAALREKGSVWQFYQLTMTQWPIVPLPDRNQDPAVPANTFPGTGAQSAFANTTLETWDQTRIRAGCMGCHNATKVHDFVWSLTMMAFQARPPQNAVSKLATTQLRPSADLQSLKAILSEQFKP